MHWLSWKKWHCEKVLVLVNLQMIGIESWVNKDYIIQFVSNLENIKFQIVNLTSAKCLFSCRKHCIKALTWVRFYIRCIFPRMQHQWLFISDKKLFMAYTKTIIQHISHSYSLSLNSNTQHFYFSPWQKFFLYLHSFHFCQNTMFILWSLNSFSPAFFFSLSLIHTIKWWLLCKWDMELGW